MAGDDHFRRGCDRGVLGRDEGARRDRAAAGGGRDRRRGGARRAAGDRRGRLAGAQVRGRHQVGVHGGGRRGVRHRVGEGAPRDSRWRASTAARTRPGSRPSGRRCSRPRSPRRGPSASSSAPSSSRTSGSITQQGLDDARTAREAAAATTRRCGRRSESPRQGSTKALIRAPFDGVVAARIVNVGDRVESMGGGPMFRIVDTRVLDLTVHVPSARLCRAGDRPRALLHHRRGPRPHLHRRGGASSTRPSTDASRAIPVMAEVRNDDDALRAACSSRAASSPAAAHGCSPCRAPRCSPGTSRAGAPRCSPSTATSPGAARSRPVPWSATSSRWPPASPPARPVVTRGGFNVRDGDRVVAAGV